MRAGSVSAWAAAARPKTLPAAIVPVVVGSALAQAAGAFSWAPAAACLAFALLVQIATNFANDYFDFVKGADTAERRGPRRAVASGWIRPEVMWRAARVTFALAFVCGLVLVAHRGWILLPVGLSAILCGLAYTGGPYPLGYKGLGDLFVFLFFGLVAVCGTFFVLAGYVSAAAIAAAIPVGLLAANLLLVNNYRDVETDARAGKRTLVVRWGKPAARTQYALSLAAGLAAPPVLWLLGESPWVLLVWALALPALGLLKDLRPDASGEKLNAVLVRTARYLALYGLLLSAGLMI